MVGNMVSWVFNGKYSFEDKNFAKIYSFYVLETPVSGVSVRGTTFKKRGINMNSLNAEMKRATPFLKRHWFDKNRKDILLCCKENNIYDKVSMGQEIAIHTVNSTHCSGKTDSLFYAIRCAFAHGSFAIHNYKGKDQESKKYYILENRDHEMIKARLVVKEESLLRWIEIVESNPQPKKRGFSEAI